jgi:hypothetical protein
MQRKIQGCSPVAPMSMMTGRVIIDQLLSQTT